MTVTHESFQVENVLLPWFTPTARQRLLLLQVFTGDPLHSLTWNMMCVYNVLCGLCQSQKDHYWCIFTEIPSCTHKMGNCTNKSLKSWRCSSLLFNNIFPGSVWWALLCSFTCRQLHARYKLPVWNKSSPVGHRAASVERFASSTEGQQLRSGQHHSFIHLRSGIWPATPRLDLIRIGFLLLSCYLSTLCTAAGVCVCLCVRFCAIIGGAHSAGSLCLLETPARSSVIIVDSGSLMPQVSECLKQKEEVGCGG